MEKLYYLDNASTTKVFDEVFDEIKKNNDECFYNPSAIYSYSIKSKKLLDNARERINEFLHGAGGKLYFTSSATESNNTVFYGVHLRAGQTVLISAGEHPSVYNSAHNLEKKGIKVLDIPLEKNGKVKEESLIELLNNNDVALVSIIHVSNETGAINDLNKLSKIIKAVNSKIIFHSDGVQAFGKIKVNLRDSGVDLYTISAHKVYAPRGIAGLWIKNNIIVDPLFLGGGQENGFRSSTENVAGAVAFAYSIKKVSDDFETNTNKIRKLKEEFVFKLKNSKIGDKAEINSDEHASPYILSISFDKIKGEVLVRALEENNILISTGSACSSKKAGNRVLFSMGLNESKIIGSVRISFSPYIDYDIDYIVSCFEKNALRLYNNVKK